MKYTVTVLGLGFVGLTTALAFAEKGQCVYGFDVNKDRLNTILAGKLPFVEEGLDAALDRHLNNNFHITQDVQASVQKSDFIFLCVGTPSGENGEADLRYVYSAIDSFSGVLDDGKYRMVIVKSTVPPSTTAERIMPYLQMKNPNALKMTVIANNPEFLREGKCWDDMINADRIVCGVADKKSEEMLRSLYSTFPAPFFAVSLNTGEFIKYLSNTLLATMISYSNEMSKVAEAIGGIQIKEAFKILHLDKRWNNCNMSSYVYPGCGYGGYCLPKDTQAMYEKASAKGCQPMILKNVIEVNESMPAFMADKIMKVASKKDKIGILGLSFKPGSDDVRDSSSAKIIKLLLQHGYDNILAYDPVANEAFSKEHDLSSIIYFDNKHSLCQNADVVILITAWEEFRGIDKEYSHKLFIDCRYYL